MAGNPAARIYALWQRLSDRPGGKRLFAWLLGRAVPYSGSVRPYVVELSPGHARVEIVDRRAIRQHLGSVHAIALANVGELASGLAMTAGLPPTVRGIVTGLSIEFRKKARGRLTTTSDVTIPSTVPGPVEHVVEAVTTDESGDVVAVTRVTWRLAPVEVPRAAPADATRTAAARQA
jgi:acyl-coenzyme A thioesterase PaaI-like protein